MEILFVTTELTRYAKVGGLADVSGALPKTLKTLGHKVTVVIPKYPAFEEAGLLMARRLTPLEVTLGDKTYAVTVYDSRLPSQVDVVLLESAGLWDRSEIYGERGEDYPDNAIRFAVLSRAAAELASQREKAGQPYDVVHCNDWPTALVAKYMKDLRLTTPCVLSIHNVAHQGVFPKDTLSKIGLSPDDFTVAGAEFYGSINLLKQGIVSADVVSTVSPTYAKEIQTAEGGAKLDGVLAAKGRLVGIVNGVDYGVWNPATDSNLVARFDAEDTSNKMRCKGALQKELGLPLDQDAPLISFVGRLVQQKGVDLLLEAIPRILRGSEAQFVICGEGEPAIVSKLEAAAAKSNGRVVFQRAAAEAVVHRVFSASDLTVVPSRFEPCGLVQMYAQRYGSVPIGHRTGGLVDTIVDCDAKLETGTGFLFDEATGESLVAALQRAVSAAESTRFPALRRRVMKLDRGWERAARSYEQLYKSLARA